MTPEKLQSLIEWPGFIRDPIHPSPGLKRTWACNRCRDKNLLTECACDCGAIITTFDSCSRHKRYKHGHNDRYFKSGSENPMWKGGRTQDSKGYILIYKPNHPFAQLSGYIKEHRWIMEQHIGRYLSLTEVVHHKDGNVQNNDISNLELFASSGLHSTFENNRRKVKWQKG